MKVSIQNTLQKHKMRNSFLFSNGEKISCRFQVRYFVLSRGAKTGVMQRIMRIFETTNKGKRTTLNREVILSTLLTLVMLLAISPALLEAQEDQVIDYGKPEKYEIGGVKVTGAEYSDDNAIISIAGFQVGDEITIPGADIPRAVKALWNLHLFTNVQIFKEKSIDNIIFLEIQVEERPRLSRHSYKGAKKSHHDDLNDDVGNFLIKGRIVTENMKQNAINAIKEFYIGKGFLDAEVSVTETEDEKSINAVILKFDVKPNERVKIQDIVFKGNTNVQSRKLRKKMADTKRKRRWFASSKLIDEYYEADKESIVAYYNTLGFRDARILKDSIWRNEDGRLVIEMDILEGNRYFFRDISWKGNTIYDELTLNTVLGIAKGDVYNGELLETRLRYSVDGRDISTLYMDNGYLFFQVNPTEVSVDNDSIDMEIRIFEGPQATIDKVVVKGNDRTHEHVIRRELRTRPGQKFSRSDIIRSQREIVNLGYFNPETLGVNTPVNAQRGTVDIEYAVEEKPSDQLELSAGWGGAGRGVIGTLGVSFNNFSLRNIFNKESWSPLPQGDGQRLSLRAQTNGRFFQSYNISFTEPWLGGKKPNSFTVAGSYTNLTTGTGNGRLGIANMNIGLGTRLRIPDDNFVSNTTLIIQQLSLNNWAGASFTFGSNGQFVTQGKFNNISIKQTIARTTINDPIYPKSGSRFSLSGQFTFPFSAFRKDNNFWDLNAAEEQMLIDNTNEDRVDTERRARELDNRSPLTAEEEIFYHLDPNEESRLISNTETEKRFKWLEYHKWRFDAQWYVSIVGNLVLKAQAKIGILGRYSNALGTSPFERFVLGGDGLANQQSGLLGYDLISLRGYEVNELPASGGGGAAVFDKFTVELRYPFSLNPSATIFVLAFVEGGNSWTDVGKFNPFDVRRSAGLGLRVFLPMFGTLGFDYGLGFDKEGLINSPTSKWSDYGQFNIILGFEPE